MELEDIIADTTELLDKGKTIPPYPMVALDIKKEIEKGYGQADFDRVADLVEKDVALAGKILELMNSPFYRRSRGEVTSIRTALNFMGLQSFYGVALTMIVQRSIPKDDLLLFEKFWTHSIQTANLCKQLIGQRKELLGLQDQIYLIGLFHDFGIPFLGQLYPTYNELMEKALFWGEDIEGQEIERYKTNHCVVGYVIAKSWHLPNAVREVILNHHTRSFSNEPDQETFNTLKAFLILAELILRDYEKLKETGRMPQFTIPSSVLKVLKLSEKEILRQKDDLLLKLKEFSAHMGEKGK
jgi:HD-like signal output (HDOD) protein